MFHNFTKSNNNQSKNSQNNGQGSTANNGLFTIIFDANAQQQFPQQRSSNKYPKGSLFHKPTFKEIPANQNSTNSSKNLTQMVQKNINRGC